MQAIMSIVTPIFSSIGGAFGVTGAGSAAAGAGILGTAINGIAQISALNYQAAIAKRAAAIHKENANRIIEAGRREAKMQDEAAAVALADDIAAQGASGFALSSPSYVRRREKARLLMTQDRRNIVEDSILQARSEQEAAYASRVEAAGAKSSALFAFLGTGIKMFDSAIGGANLTSEVKRRRVSSSAAEVAYA